MKLIIDYNKEGVCLPDEIIESFIEEFLYDENFKEDTSDTECHLLVANELIITAFRVKVLSGEIPHTQIVFKFEDQIIKINKDGRLAHWPKGFCDHNDNYLDQLLNL
jgi:hypothetical protein